MTSTSLHTKPLVAFSITLMLTMVAVPVVATDADTDAAVEACYDAATRGNDVFSDYPDGVPYEVAAPVINEIYIACYNPTSDDLRATEDLESLDFTYSHSATEQTAVESDTGPVEDLLSTLDIGFGSLKSCSGGGATITGWSNTVYILGVRHHLLNEPASSYYEIVYENDVIYSGSGYTRSQANNLEYVQTPSSGYVIWDWLNIPMGGTASGEFRCLGPAITSVSWSLSGSPYGALSSNGIKTGLEDKVDAPEVLTVVAGGTTCLIPC